MNYHLTFKGHFKNLTRGQGHDLIGKGHDAYLLIGIIGLSTSMVFSSLYE